MAKDKGPDMTVHPSLRTPPAVVVVRPTTEIQDTNAFRSPPMQMMVPGRTQVV